MSFISFIFSGDVIKNDLVNSTGEDPSREQPARPRAVTSAWMEKHRFGRTKRFLRRWRVLMSEVVPAGWTGVDDL